MLLFSTCWAECVVVSGFIVDNRGERLERGQVSAEL